MTDKQFKMIGTSNKTIYVFIIKGGRLIEHKVKLHSYNKNQDFTATSEEILKFIESAD